MTDEWQTIMTPDATANLTELRDYIANTLLAPETALRYIRSIHEAINGLKSFPDRNAAVTQEPWHSLGIRKLIVKNFHVYYRVDAEKHLVYILNIIYGKRDQLHALLQMNLNQ